MPHVSLLAICGIALLAVFILLSLLAVSMIAITALFPVRKDKVDPAVVAAISTTVATLYPGARVTHIEEKR